MNGKHRWTVIFVLACFVLLTSCSNETTQRPPQQAAAKSQPATQPSEPAQPAPEAEAEASRPSAEAAPEPITSGEGDAAAGKVVYGKKCATCHGAQGEGKEAIAKMLKVELRHLGSKEVQAKSDEEVRKAITEGTGKMKPVKGLSEADLTNIVAYVRTLKTT